ncbi:MAG: class I SAM-dependent methyltransferase [Planctomycetes bacterium]|nr:class I SAM-dependent methyltransferase [Planctomycetota bacterium]
MDLQRIAKTTTGFPYMRLQQAQQLAVRFVEWQPENILEIGTYHGTGTCYLAEMVRERNGHVTTVDLPWTATDRMNRQVEQQLEACGLDNVTVFRRDDGAEGLMFEHLVNEKPPFDFVYIDGGHQWAKTVPQFCLALACLRPGGWILFDDIDNEKYPEVGAVWQHVVPNHPGVIETQECGNWGFARRA